VVLVVDDLHWADQPSVRALVFALRRLVADQVLVLLAVRDDAVAALPESLRRVVSGHRRRRARAGLDEHELRELATALGSRRSLPGRPAAACRDARQPAARPCGARRDPPGLWADERSPCRRRVRSGCWSATATPPARPRPRLLDAAAVLGVRAGLPLAAVGRVTSRCRRSTRPWGAVSWSRTPRTTWTLAAPPAGPLGLHGALGPARRTMLHLAAARLVDDRVAVLHHRVAAAPRSTPRSPTTSRTSPPCGGAAGWPSATRHLVASGRLCPDREQAAGGCSSR
jgi:hypothetical protein